MQLPNVFLSAEWRLLVLANFVIDPRLLLPLVPRGVELDLHEGQAFVSLVGFLFLRTRILGWAIPAHQHFEELNLRFYVRREVRGEIRRGVVFIKEIVPRWAIAQGARWSYNEPYATLPMRHRVANASWNHWGALLQLPPDANLAEFGPSTPFDLEYGWRVGQHWNSLRATATGPLMPLAPQSHEQFVAEHYFGYCRQRHGGTVEYRVEHPSWRYWRANHFSLECDTNQLYGPAFVAPLAQSPFSVFVADGSAVVVRKPEMLA